MEPQWLYANNRPEPILISVNDMAKIGRGFDVGEELGVVTDLNTLKQYSVKQASCSLKNCNCAVTIEEA